MKPLSAKRVAKILQQQGFTLLRQKGSHTIWRNLTTGATVLLASHGRNKPLPIGTFLAIVKQSKIPKTNFK